MNSRAVGFAWRAFVAALLLGCSRPESPQTFVLPAPLPTAASSTHPAPLVELRAVIAPDGSATAHFMGKPPHTEPGEPAPPLSFGVERLEISFPGDAKRYVFHPEGTLFFSDWSFDVFSPQGTYAALLQDRFGPYHLIRVSRLREYLTGGAAPDDEIGYFPNPNGFRPVHANLRWITEREVELEAHGETVIVLRHVIGGATRVVGTKDGGR